MRPIRLLLAVLGPALVLLAAAAWFTRPAPWTASETVREMDRRLAGGAAQVVVLGSSWAALDVDVPTLGKGLGLPTGAVVNLGQPRSGPPIWYAVAKYRVYGSTTRPRLLVLVSSLPQLGLVSVPPDATADLEQHYAEPDEVLLAKFGGGRGSALYNRVMGRRAEPRDAVLHAFRSLAVAALSPDDGVPVEERQERAGALVFAGLQSGGAVQHRFLPVTEEQGELSAGGRQAEAGAAGSFVADLADLAAQHDARLVVVLAPVASSQRSKLIVPLPVERDYVDLANARGIGWLDLRGLDYPDSDFSSDGTHMRPAAARRFTTTLAERLQALGALGDGPMAPASVVGVERVSRVGEAPAIGARPLLPTRKPCLHRVDLSDHAAISPREVARAFGGAASPLVARAGGVELPPLALHQAEAQPCAPGFVFDGANSLVSLPEGPVPSVELAADPALPGPERRNATWWIAPGTGIRWELSGLPPGPVSVEAVVRSFGDGSGAPVLQAAETASFVDRGEGPVATAALGPEGIVELRAPAGGPWLVLRRLSVVAGENVTDLVARPVSQRLDALAEVEAAGPPPPLRLLPQPEAGGGRRFQLPWPDRPLCSPLQVLVDGQPTAREADGRVLWRTQRDSLLVMPPARSVLVRLNPGRDCGASCPSCSQWHWIYPGDRLRAQLPKARRLSLSGALRAIHVLAEPMAASDGSLRLTASWGGEAWLDHRGSLAELAEGLTLPLRDFVPRTDAEPLLLELELDAEAPPTRLIVGALAL